MKFFRNDAFKKKVLWVVTIVIILSFGVFGTAYLIAGNTQTNTYAGALFGKKIDLKDYAFQQKHAEIQAIMRYGDNFKNVRDFLNLDADTWNRLVLIHEADRRKMKITNNQVIAAIERLPSFQRNGQFDTLIYNDVLRYVFKIKPRDFEEGIRDNLKMNSIFNDETRHVMVNQEEIYAEFKRQKEKIQVEYCLIQPDDYIDEAQYNETEAKLYWVEHKEDFAIPSSINIGFIDFPVEQKETDENSDEIEDETEDTLEEENPATEAVREEVKEVIAKIKEGEELEDVAKEFDKEFQSTGFFSKEDPDLSLGWSFEMLNTLFRMTEGQMAGPFELDDRFLLVKLLEKNDSYIPKYEEVLDKVKLGFLREQALETTRGKAAEMRTSIQTQLNDNFESLATALGLEVHQTPSFTRGEYLPKIGISKEFETAAFGLSKDQPLSDPIETAVGFSILYFNTYTPVLNEDYEEQKSSVEAGLLQEKKNEAFNTFMAELRQEAKLFDNIGRLRQQQAPAQNPQP